MPLLQKKKKKKRRGCGSEGGYDFCISSSLRLTMHPAIHSGLCHLRNLIIIIVIMIIIIIISKIFYEEDSVTPRWFSWGSQKITNISFKMENCKIDKKEEII